MIEDGTVSEVQVDPELTVTKIEGTFELEVAVATHTVVETQDRESTVYPEKAAVDTLVHVVPALVVSYMGEPKTEEFKLLLR